MHQCITNCPLALFVCLPVFPSLYIDSPNYICIVSICALSAAVVWSFSSVFLFAQWIARFLWPTSKVMCSIGSRQQQQQQHRCVVVVCMPFLSAATVRHLHESANESFTARLYVCLSVFAGAAPHFIGNFLEKELQLNWCLRFKNSQTETPKGSQGRTKCERACRQIYLSLYLVAFYYYFDPPLAPLMIAVIDVLRLCQHRHWHYHHHRVCIEFNLIFTKYH